MAQSDDEKTGLNRIEDRCDRSYERGMAFVGNVNSELIDITRRVDLLDAEVKTLRGRDYILNDIPIKVEEAVKKEMSEFEERITKKVDKLASDVAPITNTKARLTNVLAWSGGLFFLLIFIGLSSDEISAIIIAVIKSQFGV